MFKNPFQSRHFSAPNHFISLILSKHYQNNHYEVLYHANNSLTADTSKLFMHMYYMHFQQHVYVSNRLRQQKWSTHIKEKKRNKIKRKICTSNNLIRSKVFLEGIHRYLFSCLNIIMLCSIVYTWIFFKLRCRSTNWVFFLFKDITGYLLNIKYQITFFCVYVYLL